MLEVLGLAPAKQISLVHPQARMGLLRGGRPGRVRVKGKGKGRVEGMGHSTPVSHAAARAG